MAKTLRQVLGCGVIVLALSAAAPPLRGQAVEDTVVIINYLSLNPEEANAWMTLFKKHFQPPLDELQQQGALRDWHLFVPGLHHPGSHWTHALVLVFKDRAAQGTAEKRLREALTAMPAAESKMFLEAIDLDKHFDDEWLEVDLAALAVPEEEEEEKEEDK